MIERPYESGPSPSDLAVARAVASLFTAAGRNYGRVELEVYRTALEDVSDDELDEATVLVVRGVDLGGRAPSPGLLLEAVGSVRRRRRLERLGLPVSTGEVLPLSESAARARALREGLRGGDAA